VLLFANACTAKSAGTFFVPNVILPFLFAFDTTPDSFANDGKKSQCLFLEYSNCACFMLASHVGLGGAVGGIGGAIFPNNGDFPASNLCAIRIASYTLFAGLSGYFSANA
jgi:hypothetical protein